MTILGDKNMHHWVFFLENDVKNVVHFPYEENNACESDEK